VLESDIQQRAEIRVELIGSTLEQLLEPPSEADADAQLCVVGSRADPVAPKKVTKRPVRQRLAVRDASPFQPSDTVGLRSPAQLDQEAALADPWVSAHDHDPAGAFAQCSECLAAHAELAGSADERRLCPGQAALASPAGVYALDGPGADQVLFALQGKLERLAPHEQGLDGTPCRIVDEDGSRVGRRLESRSEIDGVPERCILDTLPSSYLTDDDGAGRRADAHAKPLYPPPA